MVTIMVFKAISNAIMIRVGIQWICVRNENFSSPIKPVLVLIGSFLRGPGLNFVFPWNKGLFFEL